MTGTREATRAARPNKALRALIEQHPEQLKPILEENSAALIRFMNEWAKLHAKDPKEAWTFVHVIEQEQATRRAEAST